MKNHVVELRTRKPRLSPTHLAYQLSSFFQVQQGKKHTQTTGDITLQAIHLICGVPGSGKTWITKQLSDYNLVPHDEHIGKGKDYVGALISAAKDSDKPILAEAPFLTRKLIADLRSRGAKVIAYHIDEPVHVIRERFERDRKKPFPMRYVSLLKNRRSADDWDHEGTSAQILETLKAK